MNSERDGVDQSRFLEPYALLKALRANLPADRYLHERYVRQFHSILDFMSQASELDLNLFRVPPAEVTYRGDPWFVDRTCERSLLITKIEGLLNLVELQPPPEKPPIGFRPPK